MEKSFTIDFDIYNPEILREAISDFREVANIKLMWEKLIIQGESEWDIYLFFNEMMNYYLWLINN